MPRVAIVAALEREVRPLVKSWRAAYKEYSGRRFRFFEGEDAVVICGGIGPEAARRAAEAVVVLYSPTIVYSTGYAGALDRGLKIGDVLRPARVVDAKDGSSTLLAGGEGILISSGSIANPQQKGKLRDAFHAQAVDMEAAAVARAAQVRGVEFAVVKAISDDAVFDLPGTDRLVDGDGQFREARYALFVAVRPWLWGRMIRLARNSGRATQALCNELQRILSKRASSGAPPG